MSVIELTSYRGDDVPGCLAACGLLRVLSRHEPRTRLSWGPLHPTLHLPGDTSAADVVRVLSEEVSRSAGADYWRLLDAGNDQESWHDAERSIDPRGPLGAALLAGGAYEGGEGGRSPLLLVTRNQTPARWGRKSAAEAARADWASHFDAWRRADASWQGWREAKGTDPAAIWLALEGLIGSFPCSRAPSCLPRKPGRSGVLCPGWEPASDVWAFPLWDFPAESLTVRSLVSAPWLAPDLWRRQIGLGGNHPVPAGSRYVRFRRVVVESGGYPIWHFMPGVL
jgi:hypothetical protein